MDILIVGAGITGCIIARMLADVGRHIRIVERRSCIGGNMKDHIDEHGILVHDYGPHAFHTNNKELVEFISRFEQWKPYFLRCGAVIDEIYTPTPFNYTTIDTFFKEDEACRIKRKLEYYYPDCESITVVEALEHEDEDISRYAKFLFEKDYAPYTAKQWGMSVDEVDPSILKRVPLRLSYKDAYFDDKYQLIPEHSYSKFFENLIDHDNIEIELNYDALEHLKIEGDLIYLDDVPIFFPIVYTGALDELFGCCYGKLPYRSLTFEWNYSEIEKLQLAPVVAYPQEKGLTRITEYKQLPVQIARGTSFAKEFPINYVADEGAEPYYPTLTDSSITLYNKYLKLAEKLDNLFLCGRLADYRYYNMDQAMERALTVSQQLKRLLDEQ